MHLIDYEATLMGLEGDRELLGRLGEIFCEDAPGLLDALLRNANAADCNATWHTLHALKGMFVQFYAKSAVERLAALESLARSGDTNATLREFKVIQKLVSDVKSEIASHSGTTR